MTETTVPAATPPAGPKGLPIIGNLPGSARDPLGFFMRPRREHGDVARFSLGGSYAGESVLVSHPDDVGRVLLAYDKENLKGFQDDFATKAVFGNGLATSEGSFWRRQRKLAAPAFMTRRIDAYGEVMVRFAEEMVEGWEEGRTYDVHEEIMRLTQRIAVKTLFDADASAEAGDVGRALDVALREMIAETNGVGAFLPHGVPTPPRLRLKAALNLIDGVLKKIIDARRVAPGPPGEQDDLLAMLMEARDEETGEGMTDEQLRDEVMTLYIAGHETTANALSWAWVLLSQNPATRTELEYEFRRVLGGRSPKPADMKELPFADAVVKEVLRLYPPAWTVNRAVTHDLEIGGRHVPKGTRIWLSQYVAHRDPRYFERPEEFRPGAVAGRARQAAAQARLLPVRRGTSGVHRQPLRPDGSGDVARGNRTALQAVAGGQRTAGGGPGDDAEAQRRSPDALDRHEALAPYGPLDRDAGGTTKRADAGRG